MTATALKTAVLISGGGSNLKALIDAVATGRLKMDIVRVISNREQAAGLAYAISAGIPVSVISQADYPDRQSHDAAIAQALQQDQPQLVVLAGYMRILDEGLTDRYCGRMINLHPSLLPAYKGLDTYNRVLQAGDRETGASIHFVSAGLDAGPVISQVRIPVHADDDADSLSSRLGPLEHSLLVATVSLFCERAIHCSDGDIIYHGEVLQRPLQMNPGDPPALSKQT